MPVFFLVFFQPQRFTVGDIYIYNFINVRLVCLQEMKVDAVTARLTDTRGYTGTHKERFDTSGKGKGIAGRKDLLDDAGYVTGYKHQGTYQQDGGSPAGASGSHS